MYLNALEPPKHSAKSGNRNVREIVERVAKHRAALLLHTYDAHREAGNLDRFIDRIETREEFFTEFIADHDDISRSIHVVRSDESAIGDRFVFDLGHICGDTRNVRSEKLFTVLFQVDSLLNFGAD